MHVNDKFGKMWKEVVINYFKVLCQNLLGIIVKNHGKSQ